MGYLSEITEKEIDAVVAKIINNPGPRWPGMSYEDGVRAALEWIVGNEEISPLDD